MMVEETWRKLAVYYETCISVTKFGSVRTSLSIGGSSITGVMFVRQQQFLSKVAAALDERDIRGQDRLRRWHSEGHILIVKREELLTNNAWDESKVANDCSCELVFRPPFLVVFLRENASVVFHRDP